MIILPGQNGHFVDGDDYIEPKMYERLLDAALSEGLRMAQISRDEIDEHGRRMHRRLPVMP